MERKGQTFWAAALAASLMLVGPSVIDAAEVKTSKERLGDKASDNQRVNNCKVPVERRGPVPRPGCQGRTEVTIKASRDSGPTHSAPVHPVSPRSGD